VNPFALVSLSSFIVCLFIGTFVLARQPKGKENQLFFLYSMIVAWWGLTEYGYRQAESLKTAAFWMQITAIWPFSISIFSHLLLLLTEKLKEKRKAMVFSGLYGPAVFFTVYSIMDPKTIGNIMPVLWGWTYGIPENRWYFAATTLWASCTLFVLLFICVQTYRKTINRRKKGQLKYVAVGLSFTILLGIISEAILPILKIRLPEFTTIGFTISSFFYAYGIWKYELFVITPAKVAEEIIATMADPLFLLDRNGSVVETNQAAMDLFKYRKDEVLNRPIAGIMPLTWFQPDSPNAFQEDIKDREIHARTKKNDELFLLVSTSILQQSTEGTVGYVCIAHDITALKKTAEQAKRYNVELKRIVYLATHHLQEPLRMVASFLQLIEKKIAGSRDEDTREYMHYAVDGSVWMKHMLNDLTTYSAIDPLARTRGFVDSEEALKQVLADLGPKIRGVNARITHDPFPGIWAAKDEFILLLKNLIGNCLKFRGSAAPEIHLSARQEEKASNMPTEKDSGQWVFSVKDNGIGIAPEYHTRIFELFEKLHPRSKYYGTGTGLAVCKKIVENHGGRIWVESEEEKGSIFYFTIPIA